MAATTALVGIVVFSLAPRAAAHTSLVDASPEPDSIVGGNIERIDLEFGGNVSGPGVSVRGPDGERIGGDVSQPFTNRVSLVLAEPLTAPGRYWVDYAIVSTDGDRVDQSYGFDFEVGAPQPRPLPQPSSGPSQLLLITVGVGLGFACIAGFTRWQSRERAGDTRTYESS